VHRTEEKAIDRRHQETWRARQERAHAPEQVELDERLVEERPGDEENDRRQERRLQEWPAPRDPPGREEQHDRCRADQETAGSSGSTADATESGKRSVSEVRVAAE
jgi:hypothetical protein